MTNTEQHFDIVLKNGRVIDPETYTDGIFNVGINGGSIASVSSEPLTGVQEYDVSGYIVSPGFIDTHCHGMNIASNRIQAFDGVTTSLELEAGRLSVGEFYDNKTKQGMVINYGVSSGWAYGRLVTMNPELSVDDKPQPTLAYLFDKFGYEEWTKNVATDRQIDEIMEWTEQGIKEGGIGIGVLWGYAPGAGTKEMLRLWQLAAKYNVPTCTHIQNLSVLDPKSGVQSMVGMMGLAAATGAHTHICHWNSTSLRDIPTIRTIVQNAQKNGLRISTEAYVYGAANSAIGAAEFDPEDVEQRLQVHFSDFTLVKTNKTIENKQEFELDVLAAPGDAVVVHLLDEDHNRRDSSLLDMSVLFPGTNICSDAISWLDSQGNWFEGSDWPLPEGLQSHPRAAGNFTRFLRRWVRERDLISWMDAIRSASLNACLTFGAFAPALQRKGRLQEGMDADIIVFDPETVADKATFQEPCQLSVGMKHVIVNGTFVIKDAELDVYARPGQPVRGPILI